MAVVPSIGRANRVVGASAPEADFTRALYEEYAPQIFRYCLHQLGSREEAEDAVQSTFLNAFRGIKRGIVPELESAWLFKIAHNVCLSRRRSTWRRSRIESPAAFEVVEELAPAPSRRADELIGLQDVLEGMPEQQRRAILLREWQGLSYREIASELELSQSAVETLIFRARRSLAHGLEQPVERRQRRRRFGAGALANLLSSAQSFLVGGGAAAKVVATVAVVGAGTVVATAPHHRDAPVPHRAPAPAAHPVKHVRTPTRARDVVVAPPVVAPPVVLSHVAHPVAPTPARKPAVHEHATRREAARPRTKHLPKTPETPAPAKAHGAHGQSAAAPGRQKTPPGQAKKSESPATAPVRPTPPGQAKKTATAPAPVSHQPVEHGQGHGNSGGEPGNAKGK